MPKQKTNKTYGGDQVHNQVTEDLESEGEEELGHIYHQNFSGLVWKTCLLIDSESGMDIFNNDYYQTGIHKIKKPPRYTVMMCSY